MVAFMCRLLGRSSGNIHLVNADGVSVVGHVREEPGVQSSGVVGSHRLHLMLGVDKDQQVCHIYIKMC